MNNRISYIDGLRGIACILVFVNHFLMAFYPASYFGADAPSHFTNGIDSFYAQSFLSVLSNGNFWVCVFFVISAFIISYKILKKSEGDAEQYRTSLANGLIKRYPRLMLPVSVVCLLILFASWLGFFVNNAAAQITGSSLMLGRYDGRLTFYDLITSVFVKIWFFSDETFSNSFWMLSTLFLGGFLSTILSIMAGRKHRRMLFLYGFFSLLCIAADSLYLTFVLGTSLAYIIVRYETFLTRIKSSIFSKILMSLSLLLGLFLGGYPSGIVPTNYYRFLNHLPASLTPTNFYHMLGAFFVVSAIVFLPRIQILLSTKPILFLGDVSFAVYLFNLPLIFSFSSGMLLWLSTTTIGTNYQLCAIIIFITSTILLLLLSYLFHRYIESFCNRITNAILSFMINE